jgi:hypothetical protein
MRTVRRRIAHDSCKRHTDGLLFPACERLERVHARSIEVHAASRRRQQRAKIATEETFMSGE